MRVLAVRMQSFGALSGRFKLDEHLTLIGGPNESGKSTLHTALRVGLCGLVLNSRGRQLKETEEVIRRFRPWQGKQFLVETEVELQGGRYRFVRDLDDPDNCHVFDLVRGGDVTDEFRRGRAVDVSVKLGMSRDAFLAVSTVAQDQILSLSGGSLQDDLQRASSTSGSDGTARAAIDLLTKWRTEHIRGDHTRERPLDGARRGLDTARGECEQAVRAHSEFAEELARVEQLRSERGRLEQAAAQAEANWKGAQVAELEQDQEAISGLDREIEAIPTPKLPKDPAMLRDVATGVRPLAKQWQEAEAKAHEAGSGDAELQGLAGKTQPGELAFLIRALEEPLPELPDRSDAPGRLDLLDRRRIALHRWTADVLALVGGIAGILLILRGVTLPSGQSGIGYVAGGLVALVITATFFLTMQRRIKLLLAAGGFTSVSQLRRAVRAGDPEVAKANQARAKVEAGRDQAGKRLSELGVAPPELDHLRQLEQQLPTAIEEAQQRATWAATAERYKAELVSRAKRVGISGNDPVKLAEELAGRLHSLIEAEDAAQQRKELEGRRTERLAGREPKAIAKQLKQLQEELARCSVPPDLPQGVPADELRGLYDGARADVDRVREELLPMEGSLNQQLAQVGDVAQIEERVAELEAQVQRLEAAEAAVKLALSELEKSEGKVHRDLAPVLAEGLRNWLPAITGQRYQQAWVDPQDLAMHVSSGDSGAQIAVRDLSQGTREQLYVALRMVLARALSPEGEPVPLFFDDPTVSADDARCLALLDSLRELSQGTQVVLFSHETRVGSWAKRNEVPILTMPLVPAEGRTEEPVEAAAVQEG